MALMQFTLERLQESSFRICLVMQSNKNELRMEDFPGGTPTTGGGASIYYSVKISRTCIEWNKWAGGIQNLSM